MRRCVLVVLLVAAGLGCRGEGRIRTQGLDQNTIQTRLARLDDRRAVPDSLADSTARDTPLARWIMPASLNEISGLAMTPDGRLLAHEDERGIISEIDPRTGVLRRQYELRASGDFEGIAVVDHDVYLLASNGEMYRFRDDPLNRDVPFTRIDTRLGKECEFEGLAYDRRINSLLLACKNVGKKSLDDRLVIYRWVLDEARSNRISRITVPQERIAASLGEKEVHPSGIEVDPLTGHYVIVASQERALVILTPDGGVVAVRRLPQSHDQPEGITITDDSLLVIADEAVNQPATITLYRWP